MPLYKHGPGRPIITDEAYELSHIRIEHQPPRAAAFTSLKGDHVTMDGKSKSGAQNRKRPLRSLEAIQPDAAGIDLGSRDHWVAGPPCEDGTPNVKRFGWLSFLMY